jgi:hypothetical protein
MHLLNLAPLGVAGVFGWFVGCWVRRGQRSIRHLQNQISAISAERLRLEHQALADQVAKWHQANLGPADTGQDPDSAITRLLDHCSRLLEPSPCAGNLKHVQRLLEQVRDRQVILKRPVPDGP